MANTNTPPKVEVTPDYGTGKDEYSHNCGVNGDRVWFYVKATTPRQTGLIGKKTGTDKGIYDDITIFAGSKEELYYRVRNMLCTVRDMVVKQDVIDAQLKERDAEKRAQSVKEATDAEGKTELAELRRAVSKQSAQLEELLKLNAAQAKELEQAKIKQANGADVNQRAAAAAKADMKGFADGMDLDDLIEQSGAFDR